MRFGFNALKNKLCNLTRTKNGYFTQSASVMSLVNKFDVIDRLNNTRSTNLKKDLS